MALRKQFAASPSFVTKEREDAYAKTLSPATRCNPSGHRISMNVVKPEAAKALSHGRDRLRIVADFLLKGAARIDGNTGRHFLNRSSPTSDPTRCAAVLLSAFR